MKYVLIFLINLQVQNYSYKQRNLKMYFTYCYFKFVVFFKGDLKLNEVLAFKDKCKSVISENTLCDKN